jgi:hypothetical protein
MKTLMTLICAALLGFSVSGKDTNAVTQAESKRPMEFQFNGGSLSAFINAVRTAFGVDLNEAATVPQPMYLIQVPKLRLKVEGKQNPLTVRDILHLYNNVSEKGDASLGRWIIEPSAGEPQTILLVATGPRAESSFAVRAFSFPFMGQDATRIVEILQQTVITQRDILRANENFAGLSDADLRGGLDYHKTAGILVASGGKVYVEMATSIIQAYKEKIDREGNNFVLPDKPKSEQP